MPQFNEAVCAIALTRLPGISRREGAQLCRAVGSARGVLSLTAEQAAQYNLPLDRLHLGLTEALDFARREWEYCQSKRIQVLPILDEAYPKRLRETADPPLVLYYLGRCDLNASHVLSIVGTRKCSDYGRTVVDTVVADAAQALPGPLVVSGLAYGIDIQAHRAALRHQLPTIGVLAHGLDRIYPPAHRETALSMLQSGGLLTEYPHGTPPEAYNFLQRNRIVAGLADATLVVESASHGGALATARLAFDANRQVFACPGRLGDAMSAGCNDLIRKQVAHIYSDFRDLMLNLNWAEEQPPKKPRAKSRPLATPESPSPARRKVGGKAQPAASGTARFDDAVALRPMRQQHILQALRSDGRQSINALSEKLGLPVQDLTGELFELEMDGLVKALPGCNYCLAML